MPKHDIRVEAYGNIDELNAVIGVAGSHVTKRDIQERLSLLQSDLFVLGAHLATPVPGSADARSSRTVPRLPELPATRVEEMETWIDEAEAATPPLRHFIVPAGSVGACYLQLARTVCRRAERWVARLAEDAPGLDPLIIRYLNRLSDYLFVAARLENLFCGKEDVEWRGVW